MKKKVAVIAGGNSGEYEVSMDSAAMVIQCLDKEKYEPCLVVVRGLDWYVEDEGTRRPVNRSFFTFERNGETVSFDVVYNIIHGTPGEDGILQGYFALLNLPLVGPGLLNCALTMNKMVSKHLAAAQGVPVARAVTIERNEAVDYEKITEWTGYPCFLKPNSGGSSVATYKIREKNEFPAALKHVFEHDNTAIFEEFIQGTEVACGIFRRGADLICLPVTEIVPFNDFFDYEAKYKGQSSEITPARLPQEVILKLNEYTRVLYSALHCNGMVRIDFIVKDSVPYFLEANTIPGFTRESLLPQQIRAAGLSEKEVLTYLIEETLNK